MNKIDRSALKARGYFEKSMNFIRNNKRICTFLTFGAIVAIALLRDIATGESQNQNVKPNPIFPTSQDLSAQGNSRNSPSFNEFLEERERERRNEVAKSNVRSKTQRAYNSKPQIIGRPTNRDLPLGSEVWAVLLTGAGVGPVKAKLTEALSRKGEIFFPEGSVVLGSAQVSNRRVQVKFSKVIINEDEVIGISGTALDGGDLVPGIRAPWIEERGLEIAATMGGSLLESTATILEERESVGPYGMEVRKLTPKNAALGALGKTAKNETDFYLGNLQEQAKNFSVPAGTKIKILFQNGSE